MGDQAPTKHNAAQVDNSQGHAHEVLTRLTVVRGRIQMARRHLMHRDGPEIGRALACLDIADSHVARAATVVHRRVKKPRLGTLHARQ